MVRESIVAHGIDCDVLPCDPDFADTAAFCTQYGFPLESAANTILVASKKSDPPKYAVCVALGTTALDVNHRVRDLLGVKRLSFADTETTIRLTGMMIGGVTAFGIEESPLYIDAAVMLQPTIVMGGGNRSSKLAVRPTELLKLPNAQVVDGLAVPRG